MAFIPYLPQEHIPAENRVPDSDHIIQIHSVHSETMIHHYQLYIELMRRRGALTRIQREMIAVAVSSLNRCHY